MIELIGQYDFKDIQISIYYNPEILEDKATLIWRARNPETFYQGVMFQSIETGQVTYPVGADIPKQCERDREILPNTLIIGVKEINDTIRTFLSNHLEKEYRRRNRI